jgi:DNA (cytosine-5)-methyltransferase 1
MGCDVKWGVVELFAGIGGVAQGFTAQGKFEIIALTDIDADARDTFLENFPQFPPKDYLIKDVRDLTANHLRNTASGRPIHGLLGCPPCQGFSAAGKLARTT